MDKLEASPEDIALVRNYLRDVHRLLVGDRTAERAILDARGELSSDKIGPRITLRGRNNGTGYPAAITILLDEIRNVLSRSDAAIMPRIPDLQPYDQHIHEQYNVLIGKATLKHFLMKVIFRPSKLHDSITHIPIFGHNVLSGNHVRIDVSVEALRKTFGLSRKSREEIEVAAKSVMAYYAAVRFLEIDQSMSENVLAQVYLAEIFPHYDTRLISAVGFNTLSRHWAEAYIRVDELHNAIANPEKALAEVNGSNMQGKICLITGATNGIGKETALGLAKLGATVIVVGRNHDLGAVTVAEIKQKTGNGNIESMTADLSSLAEVRRLAKEFKAKYNALHVLINNAGAIFLSRQLSPDGIEMTFALNHLSYFLLTNLLLDLIKASAPGRIVNVSSDAHEGGHINFDDLQGAKGYTGLGAYGQSKLANIMFTYELARRLSGTGVTANVLHPGFVRSRFAHNNGPIVSAAMSIIHRVAAISVEQGADTSIYLASSPEVEGVTGKYFVKKKDVKSNAESYDEAAQARLWEISEEMTGIKAAAMKG